MQAIYICLGSKTKTQNDVQRPALELTKTWKSYLGSHLDVLWGVFRTGLFYLGEYSKHKLMPQTDVTETHSVRVYRSILLVRGFTEQYICYRLNVQRMNSVSEKRSTLKQTSTENGTAVYERGII